VPDGIGAATAVRAPRDHSNTEGGIGDMAKKAAKGGKKKATKKR
jgi:hypothetical protein